MLIWMLLSFSSKLKAGELKPLVGVENFRFAITTNRFLYDFHAEVNGQRLGHALRQHPAT
jgi:hypothetical protein